MMKNEIGLFEELTKNLDIPSVFNQNMKTDIMEEENQYVINTELPGYRKEDIQVSLQNGNLTIHAAHNENKSEKDSDGRVIRSERFHGSYERSFYVGDAINENEIVATYGNGVLKLTLPKHENIQQENTEKYIEID